MYNLNEAIEYKNYPKIKETADKITKDWTAQQAIYETFVDEFKLNKAIKSPLREDGNPSFAFYINRESGDILWKDYATGDKGNWITFLKRIFNTSSYIDALERYEGYAHIIKPRKTVMHPHNKAKIRVKRRAYTNRELQWWGEYGISRDTLGRYNVYPIKYYMIDEVSTEPKDDAYCFKVFNHFKIYRPHGPKKDKWRQDITSYDIQGYEQLEFNKNTLIITKSLKDVMVLREMGYEAIAPSSESARIPMSIIKILEEKYPKIYILYDNDDAGENGAIELNRSIKRAKLIFIPKSTGCKDISDLVRNTDIYTAGCILLTQLQNGYKEEQPDVAHNAGAP